ncbi:citrate (Si)-synthase [Lujinxingia litoralis]|uniref:Citrate synthase n=1 Tax=Lujinxingia litoralis TaxID=2211119 RepID=A0A328C7A7_9DELT|nr:citrate synthase [Lujinxingia litoralis]RAL23743.1 citrate (Si)-synthase [Lujinxingia litoralis]
MSTAKLTLNGNEYELPTFVGSEGEVAIEIAKLRGTTGAVTLDSGYGNTGSCKSEITFIDGEKGILRYRGYSIEELAEKVSFEEVAYLVIWGELPNQEQLAEFQAKLAKYAIVDEGVKTILSGFPRSAHPMAMLGAVMAAFGSYYETTGDSEEDILRIIAGMNSLAAYIYRYRRGLPYVYPASGLSYAGQFLHQMWGEPTGEPKVNSVVEQALNKLLILHADHEQNCSASTVRMVGSAHASLYASISAGVGALSGPLHGGANQAVLEMLEEIQNDGGDFEKYVGLAKDKESGFRLMGFGHRVYKNFDPRAKILKSACDDVLEDLGVDDPLLDIAKKLEKVALEDEFFVKRKLYPNVDFYSGIIYRALNIPTEMFTVMFALGRVPGWIAQWHEMRNDPTGRIHRPRQIYTGATERSVQPIEER